MGAYMPPLAYLYRIEIFVRMILTKSLNMRLLLLLFILEKRTILVFLCFSLVLNSAPGQASSGSTKMSSVLNYSELTILTGGAGEALSYSLHNDVVAIALLTGTETPHSAQDIAQAIKNNIFTGKQDIPLAVFIDPKPTSGKGDISMGVYIRGHHFRDDYTNKDVLDAKTLRECAGQIMNKFKTPDRRVDKNNALSGDW